MAHIFNGYRTLRPQNRVDQLFSSNGDGTGTVDMAAGSATYTVVAGLEKEFSIRRLLFRITDGAIRMNRFAGEATLDNGILITAHGADDALLHTYTPLPIKKLNDFGLLAGPDVPNLPDTGDDTFIVRWTLNKAGRDTLLTEGAYLKINIRDSLAGLTDFHCCAQGWWWGVKA